MPVAVDVGSLEPAFLPLGLAALDARRLRPPSQRSADRQPSRSAGATHEADDTLAALERLAAPGGRAMADHTGLDRMPLARPWRNVADTDATPGVLGEALQGPLPEPSSGPGTAPGVGSDEELLGLRRH